MLFNNSNYGIIKEIQCIFKLPTPNLPLFGSFLISIAFDKPGYANCVTKDSELFDSEKNKFQMLKLFIWVGFTL